MAYTDRELVTLNATTDDFRTLFARSSAVPEALRSQLRANIRAVAQTAANASRSRVLRAPLTRSSRPRHRGLRQGISDGIKVSVITAAGRPGVVIASTGAGLSGSRQRLAGAYNRPAGWRHPVFGNKRVYVSQIGQPGYFTDVVASYRPQVTDAVLKAMQQAVAGLAGQGQISQAAGIQARLTNTGVAIRTDRVTG